MSYCCACWPKRKQFWAPTLSACICTAHCSAVILIRAAATSILSSSRATRCLMKRSSSCRRGMSNWIIQRYTLRENGVVLAGPPPHTLIDPVQPNDIRQAVRGILRDWWQPMLSERNRLAARGLPAAHSARRAAGNSRPRHRTERPQGGEPPIDSTRASVTFDHCQLLTIDVL